MVNGPDNYGVYSQFDIAKHKETFVHYLEVIIHSDGLVEYAVPSHQKKLIQLAARKLGVPEETIPGLCPQEYHGDYMVWLSKITGCIAVWNDFYHAYEISRAQALKLRSLKVAGIYHGTVPPLPGDRV